MRAAVLKSDAQFENVDCKSALKHLYLAGGAANLKECGLGRVAPRWTGRRPDLLSVGGESGNEDHKWIFLFCWLKLMLTDHRGRLIW